MYRLISTKFGMMVSLKMCADCGQRNGGGGDGRRLCCRAVDVVHEDRQPGDVVNVGVRQ